MAMSRTLGAPDSGAKYCVRMTTSRIRIHTHQRDRNHIAASSFMIGRLSGKTERSTKSASRVRATRGPTTARHDLPTR